MRPERLDIAAPDLPATTEWIGEPPRSMPVATAGGPALVHFVEYAQLNSVRTLPYLNAWADRYTEAGLTVLGVQAPRFPFAADPGTVAAGLARLGVEFPVAVDADRELWHSYGCEGWPSLFLWRQGGALSWFHFGEGEYLATEEAIQEELRKLPEVGELPSPLEPLRATDVPGAGVMPPTPEIFPGGSWERPWEAGSDGTELTIPYEAGGAFATLEGDGEVELALDGEPRPSLPVDLPALYQLAGHPRHEAHEITLRPAPGMRVWSIGFAAGVPA